MLAAAILVVDNIAGMDNVGLGHADPDANIVARTNTLPWVQVNTEMYEPGRVERVIGI